MAQSVAWLPRRLKAIVAFTTDAISLSILLLTALILRRGSFEQALAVPPLLFAFVPSVPLMVFTPRHVQRRIPLRGARRIRGTDTSEETGRADAKIEWLDRPQ